MNKIFKVIWNEARNAYVVVSEIAKNHGSKSCSTKKLLAMLIATGVMTCASFDVLAAEPAAKETNKSQYVAFKDDSPLLYDGKVKKFGGYNYIYDATNKYWVREGYVLTVDENGGKYTPLSQKDVRADVAYTRTGVPKGILQSVTSTVSASGTVTNMGESLNKITAGSFAGVSHAGGTEVEGSWDYIIKDASWEGEVDSSNYKDGYVNLYAGETATAPKGFVNTDSKDLIWDDSRQAYFYKNQRVDYSNMYVINGKLGVFTNADSTKVYTGTVYGKNNEILMTVKDKDNNFYSYWAAEVTDPSATMATYRVEEYNKNLAKLVENDDALNRNDIKEVTLTNEENSATIGLMRNGDKAVDGAITVTSGGGTGGSGAAHDTFVKISNGTTEQTFATGSKVEAIFDNGATTGIKINGQDYTIKSGSKVSVAQNDKTTTITVDDKATTITDTDTHNALKSASLSGKTLTITGKDDDSVNVDLSSIDTDTKYTAGNGIAIDKANAISVKLNKDEKNLVVDGSGLALNTALTGIQSITGAGSISFANGGKVKVNDVIIEKGGKITGVADGKISADSKEAVNGSQLNAVKETANKGWNLSTNGDEASTKVAPGETVDFSGDKNISVSHDGTNVKVELNDELKDIKSISNGNKTISLDGTALLLKNGDATLAIAKGAAGMQNGAGASVVLNGTQTVINGGVTFDHTGKITNVKAGEADTDAVNVSQLNAVKETANKGWNLSTNGGEASKVAPDATVDFSGDKNISVSHDGTKVQVELNKNIDVNYVQTNALNAKYNLSVGTANENGTVPFLVNSTGAFYAANNNFSVDKYGKVIATAGEIGNVVLQNGVYTGNSALSDGELYLGDASGNYSQITTTGAKLGQVTIAADGKISGVAAGEADTDAVNVSQLNAVATEAGKHTTLSNGKNTTVESTVKDGQTDYKVNVAGDLTDITSVANGDSKINLNKDSIIISNGNKYFAITNSGIGMSYIGADYSAKSIMLGENGTTISGGLNVAGSKITNVAAGVADTDAVNVGQLKEAVQAGNTDTHIKPGEYGVGADNKVNMDVVDKNGNKVDTVTIKDVAKASDVGNVNNIASDIKNQDGSHTTVVDAVNNLNKKLDNKVGDLNYVEGGKGNYVTNGENTTTSIGKLDQALKDVADTANQGWNLSTNGGEASKVAPGKTVDFSGDKNIIISNDGTNVKVKLNEAIDVNTVTANTVTTGNTVMNSDGVKVGADVSLNQNGLNVGKDVSVTATAVTAGKTSISDEGVKVGDKTYISADGLNANGQHITNVKAGEADTDAVNYGQLKDTNNRINGVENQVISNSNRINQLGNRVNKVGAGAAALAALHPMDFDPDDKLTFSAGYGNYGGENAAAIGAYYRPDEKVMFSVAGTVGNGENMVNAGVSFALDRTNHVSNSRTALAREVIDLRGQLAVMGAKMAKMEKAFGMLDETKTKLFPDVPANHWAYEYIAKLAGNGYIEGYPDGNFGGDRLMTRYEFAAMLYRAIEKGAALEEKIIKEFEPELGRIRVDRISGEDGDRDKIERVRVNDTKGERDHYGNKLAK